MTDLTAKFTALETALSGKLDTVIARLDSLITAVTSGGSIDAAPIVAAIEAMRGTGPENTVRSLNQSIWNMVGPSPGYTISDIYTVLNGQISGGAGISLYNLLDLMYQLLVKSNNALGAEPQSSLEPATVRGILWSILDAVGQNGILPDGNLGDYHQSANTYSEDGRRYLVWPDLAGLTESTDGVELTPDTSWDGYEIYIQTSAPNATLHDITEPAQSIAELSVNTWNPLGASHTLSFSVDSSYLVIGYMRVPAQSQIYTWSVAECITESTSSGSRYVPDWSKYPELDIDDRGAQYTSGIVLSGAWHFEITIGTDIQMGRWIGGEWYQVARANAPLSGDYTDPTGNYTLTANAAVAAFNLTLTRE